MHTQGLNPKPNADAPNPKPCATLRCGFPAAAKPGRSKQGKKQTVAQSKKICSCQTKAKPKQTSRIPKPTLGRPKANRRRPRLGGAAAVNPRTLRQIRKRPPVGSDCRPGLGPKRAGEKMFHQVVASLPFLAFFRNPDGRLVVSDRCPSERRIDKHEAV